MGMITESQILRVTEQNNELLGQLLAEVRRTNELLVWLGQVTTSTAAGSALPTEPVT